MTGPLTRRQFSLRLASLGSVLGFAGPAVGPAFASGERRSAARSIGGAELSHSAGVIHQEVVFSASPKRIYEALTETKQFDRVVKLSEAGMSLGTAAKSTEISRAVGGSFSLFGGYIVGRHIEMLANQRLVQAWREKGWPPGVYSIVRFELTEQGAGTKLVFDHTGFPGTGEHLVIGWQANYWEPLKKYLT